MTLTPIRPQAALSFDRTLDRSLVHRRAVSEVFLTDLHRTGESTVVVGAHLPTCHSYFHDHVQTGPRADVGAVVDPLLVMEIGRQATLATAHALGVPTDTILISSVAQLRITDRDAWRAGPTTIWLESSFTWTRIRSGRPRAGICDQIIHLGDRPAATHSSSGQLLSRDELQTLREVQRSSPAPWTADLPDTVPPDVASPADVGRRDPRNVVLAGIVAGTDEISARIAPRLSNPALFDHSYDHVTMQVLIEASRQLATLATRTTHPHQASFELRSLEGSFRQFAELDAPVTVRAPRPPQTAKRVVDLPIEIEQSGSVIAGLTLGLHAQEQS